MSVVRLEVEISRNGNGVSWRGVANRSSTPGSTLVVISVATSQFKNESISPVSCPVTNQGTEKRDGGKNGIAQLRKDRKASTGRPQMKFDEALHAETLTLLTIRRFWPCSIYGFSGHCFVSGYASYIVLATSDCTSHLCKACFQLFVNAEAPWSAETRIV
jgi:hypothetical protein